MRSRSARARARRWERLPLTLAFAAGWFGAGGCTTPAALLHRAVWLRTPSFWGVYALRSERCVCVCVCAYCCFVTRDRKNVFRINFREIECVVARTRAPTIKHYIIQETRRSTPCQHLLSSCAKILTLVRLPTIRKSQSKILDKQLSVFWEKMHIWNQTRDADIQKTVQYMYRTCSELLELSKHLHTTKNITLT